MTPPHDYVSVEKCTDNQHKCRRGLYTGRMWFMGICATAVLVILGILLAAHTSAIAEGATQNEHLRTLQKTTEVMSKVQDTAQRDRDEIKKELNNLNIIQQVMQKDIKYLVDREKAR